MSIVSNVAWNWIGRRAMEIGGLGWTLYSIYAGMPPDGRDAVNQLFQGHWEGIQLGAIAGIALYLWTQRLSWKATTGDQVVVEGKKVVPEKSVVAKQAVETVAASTPPKPRNPLEALANIFRR